MKSVTLTEARSHLLQLVQEIEQNPQTVVGVSKRGKPVMTLLSSELYESLIETLEILAEEPTARDLRKALREIERGRRIPWETAKKRLGLLKEA